MLNEIFEIANQAYILQQKSDSEEIDSRNWREWMKMFKQRESIKTAYVEGKPDPDKDDDQIVGQAKVEVEEEATEASEWLLNDEELTDYLKNQGQWKTELVTAEPVNVAEILAAGEPTGGKGAKGVPAEGKLDEADMIIPNDLPKNNILGDVIEQIIYINYEGEKDIVKPEVPNHLPLKVAILGKSFAGKKTQAEMLAQKYNLVQYHPYELINEAIERAEEELEEIDEEHVQKSQENIEESKKPQENAEEQMDGDKIEEKNEEGDQPQDEEVEQELIKESSNADDKPVEKVELNEEAEKAPPKVESKKNVDRKLSKDVIIDEGADHIEVIQEGSNEEVLDIEADFQRHGSHDSHRLMPKQEKFEKLRRNIFREVGREMKEQLLRGDEINETMIVDLLIAKIKADFSYMTQEQIDDDLRKVIQTEEEIKRKIGEAETLKGKSFKNQKPIDIDALKQELEELGKFTKYGWILVDFPSSITQAHDLEAKLSGYLPSIDREISERNEKLTSACRIIEPSDKPNIRDTLIESGMDAVLWLEATREECRRRALGRRIDVTNGHEYHIDDNPPSTTNPPL
jgi:adenylate kinase family enzyme